MGGTGSGTQITYPDMSAYVWDGKDEPAVPMEVDLLDSISMTRIMLKRTLDFNTDGYLTPEDRQKFENFYTELGDQIVKLADKWTVRRKQEQELRKVEKRKLVYSQKKTKLNVALQNEDDTTHKRWKRAYSLKDRRFHK